MADCDYDERLSVAVNGEAVQADLRPLRGDRSVAEKGRWDWTTTPTFRPDAAGKARIRFLLADRSVGAVFVDNAYLAWAPTCVPHASSDEDGGEGGGEDGGAADASWEVCTGGGGRPTRRLGFGRWNADGEIVLAKPGDLDHEP